MGRGVGRSGGETRGRSVQACGQGLVNAAHQPSKGVVRRSKENMVLQHVVEIHVPATIAVESGNGSTTVDRGDELLIGWMLVGLHGCASWSSFCIRSSSCLWPGRQRLCRRVSHKRKVVTPR